MAKRMGQYAANIELAKYPPEVQQMLIEATYCLCGCGRKMSLNQLKEGRRNRGYFELSCYYRKPPKMAYTEKLWNKPVREIILQLLNEGKTIQATANLLGIEKPQFYEWLRKLGIKRKVIWK